METLIALLALIILFEIPTCFGMGLIFKKMNLDFKKGIVPFYNKIILIKKYNLPQYHLLLNFIPIINIYTNFYIYKELGKKYNKNLTDVLELTFLPFIFNIFLGLEIKQETNENVENFFDNQKKIYEEDEEKKSEIKDEYNWFPKQKIKSNTVYKASRNSLNARVNINVQKNDEIIDTKNNIKKQNENLISCPNCNAKVPKDSEICFICGTKLK